MTGYSVGEYIRSRRLYLAALDMASGREKVIDLAYKYGYETPESFTKAFSRFHGVTPMQIKGDTKGIKVFLPLTISVSVKGGNEMDYTVERMSAMKVVGVFKDIPYETSYEDIPRFWREFREKFCGSKVNNVVKECRIGEFGICIDDTGDKKKFHYMIAGTYVEGADLEGMGVYEIPALEWIKFRCAGSLPGALQSVNTKIFREWLPGNPTYEFSEGITVE